MQKAHFSNGRALALLFLLPMSTLPIAWSTAYGCFWYTHWHGFGMQNHVEVSFCIHESWFMNHKRRKTKEKKSTSVFDSESMNVEVMLPGRMVRRRTTQRAFRHRYGIYIWCGAVTLCELLSIYFPSIWISYFHLYHFIHIADEDIVIVVVVIPLLAIHRHL